MTPLRREINIPIYWLVVGLAAMLVSPLLSIFASVEIANHNRVQAEKAAAAAAKEAKEDARVRTCALFDGLLDSYIEEPPSTKSGKAIRQTYIDFYNDPQLHCQPPRTK